MTREELIEEAAKAMAPPLIFGGTFTEYSRAYDNHRVSDRGEDQEYWLILARAALAVFEKVHTPTDQERRNARRAAGECGNSECGQGLAHSGPCAPTDDEREALAEAWDEGYIQRMYDYPADEDDRINPYRIVTAGQEEQS